jgi:putative transposase
MSASCEVINVVCDNASFHNASFHDSRQVRAYLARWGGRIVRHFVPKYAPETNPLERIWWHLRENITRNHRCQSLDKLLDNIYDWAASQQPLASQTKYFKARYPSAPSATLAWRSHFRLGDERIRRP